MERVCLSMPLEGAAGSMAALSERACVTVRGQHHSSEQLWVQRCPARRLLSSACNGCCHSPTKQGRSHLGHRTLPLPARPSRACAGATWCEPSSAPVGIHLVNRRPSIDQASLPSTTATPQCASFHRSLLSPSLSSCRLSRSCRPAVIQRSPTRCVVATRPGCLQRPIC